MENTNNTTLNKPLSLLTNELEASLVNTINTYAPILHPSIIEMVVGKVYTNVYKFAEQQAEREQTEYEKALAEKALAKTQESTEQ